MHDESRPNAEFRELHTVCLIGNEFVSAVATQLLMIEK